MARSSYEIAPRLDALLINTVRASEGVTVRDEIVGGSDGRPDQKVCLGNAPVLSRPRPQCVVNPDGSLAILTSLRLEVDEGQGSIVYQEVPDFCASGPDDRHYTLNRTTGKIRFGDGARGRTPLANPASPDTNIVAREYRSGGGVRGNVGPGAISQLLTPVESVSQVENPWPAEGGSDVEIVERAKLRAARKIRAKKRAVKAEDFETLAEETPGASVGRAKAFPLVQPEHQDTRIPKAMTVIVVPDGDAPNPLPSEATLAAVYAHLKKHTFLTSEFHVVPPTYHRVGIEAEIVARSEADLAEVKHGVEDRLLEYFHPLGGGEDGRGWEFGRDIFYPEVSRVILEVPGVDRVLDKGLFIWLDGERQPFGRDVPLGAGELLYSTGHDIRVSYQGS